MAVVWVEVVLGGSRPVTSLGHQEGEKFSERCPNFYSMSNSFKLCPTDFSRGRENFSRGCFVPLVTGLGGSSPGGSCHSWQLSG